MYTHGSFRFFSIMGVEGIDHCAMLGHGYGGPVFFFHRGRPEDQKCFLNRLCGRYEKAVSGDIEKQFVKLLVCVE